MKQNTTYKQTELGLIPEDWEVKKIGDICGIYIGKDVKKDCFSYKRTPDFKFPVFSNTVDNNGLYGFYNFEEYKQHNALTVVGRGIGLGTAFVRNNSFGAIGRLIVLYPNELTSNGYLTYYINSKVKFYTESSGIPQLTGEQICKYKICIPPFPEQKKIADCLSTWDSAIEKQSQLINALTDRKKALMQQLLTGKKRLLGFSDEWKEVKLGSLGKTYNGLTGKTKEDFGEGKPFITYMNIFSNPKINISNFEYVKMGVNENQNKAIYGDIFFTVSSETPNEVGMASVLLDEINDLYLNSFCFGFRLNDFKNLLPEFSSYLFRNDLFRKDVYKLAQGSTRFNLSKLELMKIKIKLPSLSEQTAIAEILTIADRELQLQKEKLAQLQTQKKGLMQVLLTGKKRLIN